MRPSQAHLYTISSFVSWTWWRAAYLEHNDHCQLQHQGKDEGWRQHSPHRFGPCEGFAGPCVAHQRRQDRGVEQILQGCRWIEKTSVANTVIMLQSIHHSCCSMHVIEHTDADCGMQAASLMLRLDLSDPTA